jgi:hypothetical protein
MKDVIERLKHIPIPIWIGLGLVLVIILLTNKPKTVTGAGPVTGATVGTQGSQAGAGTDQQLGNLSSITQSGFSQIAKNEQTQTGLLQGLYSGMNGVGTPMQQFGGAIQSTQLDHAVNNAANTSGAQPVTSHPSASSTSLFNVPIVDASGGAGTIQVVANNAAAALENAHQGGNTPTGSATPA